MSVFKVFPHTGKPILRSQSSFVHSPLFSFSFSLSWLALRSPSVPMMQQNEPTGSSRKVPGSSWARPWSWSWSWCTSKSWSWSCMKPGLGSKQDQDQGWQTFPLHQSLDFITGSWLKTRLRPILQQQVKSIHDGLKYSCEFCDFKATQKRSLPQHVKSIHDGVKHSCEFCDYNATTKKNLQLHAKSIHDGVKHSCEL